MNGAKHTPAPWRVKPGDEGPEVWGLPFGPAESEYPIALLSDDWGEDTDSPESFHQQQQQNAALIAAAPDLLDYLERVEALEAKLIMDDSAWATGDGLPRMSQAVYDEWVALQEFRNIVKAKVTGNQ